jgi:predicted Ser/Thr protein kinase
VQYYGEYYLKGVGAATLCEVADLRFRKPAPPQILEPGKAEGALIGRLELAGYRVLGRLGEGVHGVVYRAEHTATARKVALKVLSVAPGREAIAREQFGRELASLRTQGWAGVASLVEERLDHQPPFFATDLVEGNAIDAALAQAPPERVAKVFKDICSVLGRMHEAGLVHGDLKPGNVLVRGDDSVVLLDFGMAAFHGVGGMTPSSAGAMLGAPAYLAPETIQGAAPDARTDFYGLGVLLFKVLTGHEPFEGESVHQVIQDHLHTDPPLPGMLRPDVSDGLQRICLKALEKVATERYQSAAEMGADLERVLRGEVVRTRPTAYENLLLHRVRQHVGQIQEWAGRGLLSEEEQHGLLSAYEGLQRRGLPAVMEGRVYRFWQTLVYLGGWAVINGAVLWLVLHWSELGRTGKLLLGSVPAITAYALAAAMWRLERFRLTFVALVVGILAVPLLTGVWLLDLEVAGHVPEDKLGQELFHATADSKDLTNRQLLIMSLATLAAAGTVMWFTRTTTHSAQTVAAGVLVYSAILLWFGFKTNLDDGKWATLAAKYLPLFFLAGAAAKYLLDQPQRCYQAPPWIYFAGSLLTVILITMSLYGLKEWTGWAEVHWKPASFLLLSSSGVVLTTVGLLARDHLKHRCRTAT